jgi:hypothetical protein
MGRTGRSIAVLSAAIGLLTFGLVLQANSSPTTSKTSAGIAAPLGSCTGGGGGDLGASTGGCVNPDGDFFSTCSGNPTASDDTCADLIFPSGPGGFTKLTEEAQGILLCRLNPACLGSDVNVRIPPGYNDPTHPIILRVYYDASEVLLGHPRLLEQKNSGLTILLPPCLLPPNRVFPCQAGVDQRPGGDVRINALLQSGDPKFQGFIR